MEGTTESAIVIDRDRGVATLRLNRPAAGNAIDLATSQALAYATAELDNDPDVRCVLLTGTGRFFCVGGALGDFQAAGADLPSLIQKITINLHAAVSALMRMPKPVVTAVNGPAAGAGLGLAALGDVVLAAPGAHFSTAYSAIGFTGDAGVTWLLPRLVGIRTAQDMLLTNRRMSSHEAEGAGLITRVVPDERLMDEALAVAISLAEGPVRALGSIRRLVADATSSTLEEQLAAESRSICEAAARPESREGIAAFVERRNPAFADVSDPSWRSFATTEPSE
ncbi:hypothetical protein BSL82_04865 [Tardibacter chloracetimidivorans]|uniref:Enoyl-CoA hydratase n=1 Tax=Tardibacter chloracetimidivorans TaxID=1921510 RepID=A0A1L3ZSW1_9SPHN|nr:enoyl-CoA hydratase-related protein [Tardibacter chloracetimidivorans]API58726.1 hypothetical protein BSL82_04865 [Tardibacter chloracetimidivorans]